MLINMGNLLDERRRRGAIKDLFCYKNTRTKAKMNVVK